MASFPGRETVAQALFDLVSAATGQVVDLQTSGRVLRSFDQVEPAEMPALFQVQRTETGVRPGEGLPSKRTMHFQFFLYISENVDVNAVPSRQINNMIDAIETALAPNVMTGKLTLGNLVSHAWIEGNIEVYEGVTTDGKSVAIIPIAVLLP